MRLLTKQPLVWAAGLLLVGSTALAATSLEGPALGWTPLVSLWGRGDAGTAVKALRSEDGQREMAFDALATELARAVAAEPA